MLDDLKKYLQLTGLTLQVRTLLHDYLTDEEQGSVAGRNPISSINETLREGKFVRDKTKARRTNVSLSWANLSGFL